MYKKQNILILKGFLLGFILLGCLTQSSAQFLPQKFGKGIQLLGKDSSFYVKFGFRFQTLYNAEWNLDTDGPSAPDDFEGTFLIRRSRFKFSGWALNPKLTYKFELGLSNRDIGGGNTSEFSNAPKFILDASVEYNFYKNFSIMVGQRKLPGNRERVISSGNLQFVDRSRLNSRYNIDRDAGVQFKHKLKAGNAWINSTIAITQGEGRNVTIGDSDGAGYTFHVDILPFGKFASKGDYVGADLKREPKPKLAIGLTYDTNQNAVRERGQNGSFIQDLEGNPVGRDLNTFFADLMFKYKGLSVMGEYANKWSQDNDPFVFDDGGNLIGTFFTGTGLNLSVGYVLPKDYQLAVRFTDINPDEGVASAETQYTLGFSKYIVGHKLKIQTDYTLIDKDSGDDSFLLRAQVDIHF